MDVLQLPALLSELPKARTHLLDNLGRIRREVGPVTPELADALAHAMNLRRGDVHEVASFYSFLRVPLATPRVCTGPVCDCAGARVEAGELEVACLGHCDLAPVKLRPSAELMVYRLSQEAITNVSKYAKARQVWVRLAAESGQVQVSVRDDGIGFDSAAQPGSAYGLVGMRFRVEAEGGALTVASAPGLGTQVQARVPESA